MKAKQTAKAFRALRRGGNGPRNNTLFAQILNYITYILKVLVQFFRLPSHNIVFPSMDNYYLDRGVKIYKLGNNFSKVTNLATPR